MAQELTRRTHKGIGTAGTEVYAVPTASGVTLRSVIIGLMISNISDVGESSGQSVSISVEVTPYDDTGNPVKLINRLSLSFGSSLEAIQSRVVMLTDGTDADSLKVYCHDGAFIDAVVSIIEDV